MIELVADTNIIYSALLTRGKIRSLILLRGNIRLHTPAELREELYKHTPKLQRYLELTRGEVQSLIDNLLEETTILHNKNEYKGQIQRAREIVEKVDPEDTPFIALAMHLGIPLWTGDKELIKLAVRTEFQHFKALDTRGVEMLLEGKPWREVEEYLKREYGEGG
ncbi:MAG: putative toxin-antitoxin system toxin component, PIN family [Desulfurococcales archaeon]|nr:putative toxin-antitoxin system toxin component, PIN family [Desulfurococcales archaeon]